MPLYTVHTNTHDRVAVRPSKPLALNPQANARPPTPHSTPEPLTLTHTTQVRQGAQAESKVLSLMAEDRTLSTMSYNEWWSALGRQLA
jgi:hypothetical protein